MLFNSPVFLIFSVLFFTGWLFARRHLNLGYWYVIAASFVFYGWWDWRFVFLIIVSGLIDFSAGIAIEKHPHHKRWFLLSSLAANIGTLATFKYLTFFLENVNLALNYAGSDRSIAIPDLILPVGISFYTFQSMSYTVDVYLGRLKPTRNIGQFFAYLAMFPQLVAGPIVRASDLLPELEQPPNPSSEDWWEGWRLVVHGFFKKLVIADNLAPVVNAAFAGDAISGSACYWWLVMVAFALQIYCDFSGYSDIARGLGRWMGYRFPLNFNHPYIASGFSDFWSRWHISLSTWFRDYVFIPLGGNRCSHVRYHFNIWGTMLISGFWHGAAWTFILWGAIHAALLSIEKIFAWPHRLTHSKVLSVVPGLGSIISVAVTFMITCLTWVFFRADSLKHATDVLFQMFHLNEFGLSIAMNRIDLMSRLLIALMFFRELFFWSGMDRWGFFASLFYQRASVVILAVLMALAILYRGPGQTFVYFQF